MSSDLILFLYRELGVGAEQIELALRQNPQTPTELPIVLWQYGLIDLGQLAQVLDWLDNTI